MKRVVLPTGLFRIATTRNFEDCYIVESLFHAKKQTDETYEGIHIIITLNKETKKYSMVKETIAIKKELKIPKYTLKTFLKKLKQWHI